VGSYCLAMTLYIKWTKQHVENSLSSFSRSDKEVWVWRVGPSTQHGLDRTGQIFELANLYWRTYLTRQLVRPQAWWNKPMQQTMMHILSTNLISFRRKFRKFNAF